MHRVMNKKSHNWKVRRYLLKQGVRENVADAVIFGTGRAATTSTRTYRSAPFSTSSSSTSSSSTDRGVKKTDAKFPYPPSNPPPKAYQFARPVRWTETESSKSTTDPPTWVPQQVNQAPTPNSTHGKTASGLVELAVIAGADWRIYAPRLAQQIDWLAYKVESDKEKLFISPLLSRAISSAVGSANYLVFYRNSDSMKLIQGSSFLQVSIDSKCRVYTPETDEQIVMRFVNELASEVPASARSGKK
ncbi:unnamed protein product [Amoebophrya sp. A25]|nr:unnamed protein product [Amoebophrya sp. A25]|eukprot:GSA25T00017432001.1